MNNIEKLIEEIVDEEMYISGVVIIPIKKEGEDTRFVASMIDSDGVEIDYVPESSLSIEDTLISLKVKKAEMLSSLIEEKRKEEPAIVMDEKGIMSNRKS